jgi:hypothetical protein
LQLDVLFERKNISILVNTNVLLILKLPIYEVFIILKDMTLTWQKWGSKQALEKRKTSLSLMEVFNIALECRVFRI